MAGVQPEEDPQPAAPSPPAAAEAAGGHPPPASPSPPQPLGGAGGGTGGREGSSWLDLEDRSARHSTRTLPIFQAIIQAKLRPALLLRTSCWQTYQLLFWRRACPRTGAPPSLARSGLTGPG